MEATLISIIVPAYNIESYIARCLDSILCQTHRKLEVIVVNDGSTDGTGAIIDDFARKDSRIAAIHKENGGVSSARMAGIAAAKGEYIGFVDGDDFVEPEMFAHLLRNALEHDADISHCGYQMVFPDGHIDYYYNIGRKEVHDCDQGLCALIDGSFVEPGLCNKLYRREIVVRLENSPLWDSSVRINEDLLVNYILFSWTKRSIYEDIPFYHYILRKGSAATSHASRQNTTDPVIVMRKILEDTATAPIQHKLAAERYLRVLMGVAQQSYWAEDAVNARKELKRRISEFSKIAGISKKILLMAIGVAYMQPVYKLVRKVYNRFTGVDRKYDLE